MIDSCGRLPFCDELLNSASQVSTRLLSVMSRSKPANAGATGPSARHRSRPRRRRRTAIFDSVVDELAVAAHADAGAPRVVPDVAALAAPTRLPNGLRMNPSPSPRYSPPRLPYSGLPHLLDDVGRVRRRRERVAVVADVGVDVEVVEQRRSSAASAWAFGVTSRPNSVSGGSPLPCGRSPRI